MQNRKLHKLALAATGLLLPLHLAMAQAGPADDPEEVFELNPFEVRADDVMGYYASSSLAGTRLATSLRDTASSVQVITQEFMEDIGATNLDTLMQYTTSTETAGIQGNFVGFDTPGGGSQTQSLSARENFGTTQRVRGLGNPDRTRDFFKTFIPFDSYNTNRIDINRGANSFLFGLGSPAGLVNANLKKAVYRDLSEISLRIGEGGEDLSSRLEVDFNRVIVDDVLAVRVAAVYDDKHFRQRPTYMTDRRVYGTVTYNPFRNTTIRAHYENVNIHGSPPDTLLPQENLSMFLNPPDEEFARLSVDVVDNVRTHGNVRGPVEFRQGNRLRNLHSPAQAFHFMWEGQAEASNNMPSYARVNGVRAGPLRQPDPSPYWRPDLTPPLRPGVFYLTHGNLEDYKPSGWIQQGFLDLDTFDFSKYNIAGGNDRINRDFDNYNISLQQTLFGGNAGFELAYDRQEYEFDNYILFAGGGEKFTFDINETLLFPDPDGDGMTPAPNPNYGRPMIMTQSNSPMGTESQDAYRFTGYVQHDFRDRMDGFLGSLIGRHRLTMLFDQTQTDIRRVTRTYASFTPEGTPTDLATTGFAATDFDRTMFQTIYVGPQQLNAFTDPNFTLADFVIEPMTTNLPRMERSAPVTYWNTETSFWDETTVSARWVPAAGQLLSDERVTSYAFNSQSHLLNDHLVINLGWREDQVKQKLRVNDAPVPEGSEIRIVDPEVWNLDDTPTSVVREQIFGYGVVLHLPRQMFNLPDWFDMSLHYSDTENFVPGSGLQDFLGNPLPPETGKSKEYGFTLFLFENRLVARVNWFEGALANTGSYSREINQTIRPLLNAYGSMLGDIAEFDPEGNRQIDPELGETERTDELLGRTYDARDFLAERLDPRIFDVFRFEEGADGSFSATGAGANTTDLHDNTTDGLEIEIIANPRPNWRISLNVAKYETVLNNVAPRFTDFVTDIAEPLIENFGDLGFSSPTLMDPALTIAENLSGALADYYIAKGSEGLRAQEQREWSVRLVTNYRFTEGPLRRFSIGGAFRWEDKYALGYPSTVDERGLVIPDINNPYMSSAQQNIDLFFGYGRPIFNGAVDWRVRLNIRNVNNWNSNKTSVVRVQPDGSAARARFDPPREIFITNTFSF